MERRAALLTATLGGASLCGIDGETGTLDIGKEADLIAFKRDPLTAAPRELVPAWVIRSGTVSYTHLDVYKRQVRGSASVSARSATVFAPSLGAIAAMTAVPSSVNLCPIP